jgi:hypothetical protein
MHRIAVIIADLPERGHQRYARRSRSARCFLAGAWLSYPAVTLPAMGTSDERARITAIAAEHLRAQMRPGEALGLGVERSRPSGWQIIVKSGDVGVSAHCGGAPDDDVIRTVLITLLAGARAQSVIGQQVKEARYGGRMNSLYAGESSARLPIAHSRLLCGQPARPIWHLRGTRFRMIKDSAGRDGWAILGSNQ